jgi:LysR family hydrogen peroxide-inducible transcriptional activator
VTLRDLEYACTVADLGHFSKAAEACHVGQPTLSGQIRKLEEYLGVALFERTKRSVRLTPVGREIVEIARTVLEGAERIEQTARAHRDPESGRFRLGLIPTVAPYLIPRFVVPLRRRFPALATVFVEDVTDGLTERLGKGELEAAVVATDPADPKLVSVPLFREPFRVALPPGHTLEGRDAIRPRDLDPSELLLLTDGHCLRDQALAICGVEPRDGADTAATSLETILNLVAAGHGITLVPELAVRESWIEELRIRTTPFLAPDAERTIRLVYRSGFPHAALIERVAEVVRDSLPDTVKVMR